MQVQTPFYVIKRTAVTKETALALWHELFDNADTLHKNASDLIDLCLSGHKEEKVFLSLGDNVRLKENAGWRYYSPTSGEAVLDEVRLGHDELVVRFDAADDYNEVRPDSPDLSAYVELV